MKISTLTTKDGEEIKIIDYPNRLNPQKITPEEMEQLKALHERMGEFIRNNGLVGICQHERSRFSLGLNLNWTTDKISDTNLPFSSLALDHPSVVDIEKYLRKRVDAKTNTSFRSIREAHTSGFRTFKVLYEYGEFDGHRTDKWCAWAVATVAPRTNSPWCPMCGNQRGFYGNLTKAAYYYTPERDGTPSTLTPLNAPDSKIDEGTLICAHCDHKDVLETKFMETVVGTDYMW